MSLNIMTTTEGGISILATDSDLVPRCTCLAESEDGLCAIAALCAEGLELLDIVCKGDECEELAKGAALRVAVEPHTNDMLPTPLYSGEGEVTEVGKELGLFHNNTLGAGKLGHADDGHESADGHGRIRFLIVTDDACLRAVAFIEGRCETESTSADDFIASHDSQDGGGLASEHGTEIEVEGHSGAW
jgi:hypothetical protein